MSTLRKSPFALLLFAGTLGVVLIFNAAMTAVFGWQNLAPAFGGDGIISRAAAAVYALAILDAAALAYFLAYRQIAETTWQRSITLAVAVLCLIGSIGATLTQLAGTSFGLNTLAEYQASIEFIALVGMLILTAVHAVVGASYTLLSTTERARQRGISIRAEMLDNALTELDARMRGDTAVVVDALAAEMRRQVLHELGFTPDAERITTTAETPYKPARNALQNGGDVTPIERHTNALGRTETPRGDDRHPKGIMNGQRGE